MGTGDVCEWKYCRSGTDENAKSPVLKLTYIEGENSVVLPYNWSSCGEWDREGEIIDVLDFTLPFPDEEDYGQDGYLVILGEDVKDLTMNCYTTDGMQAPSNDVEIETERYETTLSEIAQEIFQKDNELGDDDTILAGSLSEELIYRTFLKGAYMCRDRVKSRGVENDSLDNAWYYLGEERIIYTLFEAEIPANSSIEVNAVYEKQAGHGLYEEDENLDRYDIMSAGYSEFKIIDEIIEHTGSKKCEYVYSENGRKAFLHP